MSTPMTPPATAGLFGHARELQAHGAERILLAVGDPSRPRQSELVHERRRHDLRPAADGLWDFRKLRPHAEVDVPSSTPPKKPGHEPRAVREDVAGEHAVVRARLEDRSCSRYRSPSSSTFGCRMKLLLPRRVRQRQPWPSARARSGRSDPAESCCSRTAGPSADRVIAEENTPSRSLGGRDAAGAQHALRDSRRLDVERRRMPDSGQSGRRRCAPN